MEHSIQFMYIRMGLFHLPSRSLVSYLSLNIPTLIISVHGLDITLITIAARVNNVN